MQASRTTRAPGTLQRLRDALADLSDQELQTLQRAAARTKAQPAGLFAWLVHVAAWESARRGGTALTMRLPYELLQSDDVERAGNKLAAFATRFKPSSAAVVDVFAAAAELIRARGRFH